MIIKCIKKINKNCYSINKLLLFHINDFFVFSIKELHVVYSSLIKILDPIESNGKFKGLYFAKIPKFQSSISFISNYNEKCAMVEIPSFDFDAQGDR